MNTRIPLMRSLTILALLFSAGNTTTIVPAQPTHYFYTPTAYLNTDFDMVASLHELAYTLPHRFQALTSIVDNVGRICFGMRYAFLNNLNMGAGLAWSFATMPGWGGHAIHHEFEPRFGVFLAWGPIIEERFEMSLTPHLQMGDHFSTGADIGMMITPSESWSILGEFGFSLDVTDAVPYINTIWGARVHPPEIPYLSFDGGIDFVENRPEYFIQSHNAFRPFIDVVFTMKTVR
jgi:hypothetical protein